MPLDWKIVREQKFSPAVRKAAQACERKYKIPASVSLAQYALESAFGRYESGENNPFGIKGTKENGRACRTWEVINGKSIVTTAYFRNFATLDEAFEFRGRMLTRLDGYYVPSLDELAAWRQDHSFEHLCAYIRAMGKIYATDPDYDDKIIAIITNYHLQDWSLPL